MLSRFFVDRPIFAWVVAIVIMLAGALSITTLPVSQFPNIAPPQVTVTASYPGASAETITNTVTQVIEQKLTGLDNLIYMSSTSDSTGRVTITLTFESGTNPDIAHVQVQNKLSQAQTRLPEIVQKLGVTVTKSSASFLMAVGFVDRSHKLDVAALGDFLSSNIEEPLSRLNGVGEVNVFGSQYAMRIWMDPDLLYRFNLEPQDVVNALRVQNVQVAAGDVGGQPTNGKRMIYATVKAHSLFETVEEFENVVLRSTPDGATVRVKDIGTVEFGQENYTFTGHFNGDPAAVIAIKLAAGSNALLTRERVMTRLEELRPYFPEGVEVVVPFDTTPFVKEALKEVVKTLFEAILLVVGVMYLFLQNWRATIIPTIAVPVVLLGTFAVLNAMGYSINMLTMFALVLAIGLLVDDAIVVVENVERVMSEDGSDARTATIKSMQQITGALVGIAMVLSAVFLPMAFFGGTTGVIYRQFSVTIVSAMVLSVVVAVTLTPALCASMLKPVKVGHNLTRGGFFGWFNRGFLGMTHGVRSLVQIFVRRIVILLVLYAGLCGGVVWGFKTLPLGFMPQEDQGVLLMMMQMPPNATAERTDAALERFTDMLLKNESKDMQSFQHVRGFSFAGTGQNQALGFLKLKDWSERKDPSSSVNAIVGRSMGLLFSPAFKDCLGFVFPLPPVPELGVAEGFDFYLQDRAGQGHAKLMEALGMFLNIANKDPRLTQVRHNGMSDSPQVQINVDYEKARALGVSDTNINTTLNAALGASYVNDFIDRGRIKRVYTQGSENGRGEISDLGKWHVRNDKGVLVPFSSFISTEWNYGAPRLARFNAVAAVNIQGAAAPGVSSGTALQIVEDIVKNELPPGYSIEWNAVSYQEKSASANSTSLYAISILVVFLALAALYESWTIPIAVLLVVPLGVLGTLLLTMVWGKENDVYFQVGLLTTVGLVAKNAILIVEFAKALVEGGDNVIHAVVEAVRLRLRPILMTSIAFGLGVLPMALATGAGAGAQSAIGVAVLGGMLAGTFLCIFFVPVFYILICQLFSRKKTVKAELTVQAQSSEAIPNA